MNIQIGIRREDINKWEKRVPLIPSHVRELADRSPVEFRVQPSTIRVFNDADYRLAGIPVEEGLSPCAIVLALKEIPLELIEKNKVYLFFSHTAKGQSQNMPMLKRMMDLGCTIIDYEKMVDEEGRRVLYFGNYAGHAGMIDTLWTLGKRLEAEGTSNPFTVLHPTHRYESLVEAKEAVGKLAWKLIREGPPRELGPIVFGFFGYGHVSQGAQEIFDILPVETVRPSDIPGSSRAERGSTGTSTKPCSTKRTWSGPSIPLRPSTSRTITGIPICTGPSPRASCPISRPWSTGSIGPRNSRSTSPSLSSRRSTRATRGRGSASSAISPATSTALSNARSRPRIRKIPVYVYDPFEDKAVPGFAGRGPAVLAVYNLPAELPLESSTYFSGKLKDYVPAIAAARFDRPFADCGLPDVLRRAVIVYRGELTPGLRLSWQMPRLRNADPEEPS